MAKRYIQHLRFFLLKVFYELRLRFSNLQGREPIVVFQMGKVGSSTIVESLKALNLGLPIYHVHHLTQDGLEFAEKMSLARGRPRPAGEHYFTSQYLRRQLAKHSNGRRWNVVTLVREPIARNISAFFHTLDAWYPEFNHQHGDINESVPFAELTSVFLEEFPHELPLTWFDSEMKCAFGVDVFSSEFPKQKGYDIYQGERVNLLVIRLEDIAKCGQQAFSEFLDIEQFTLVNANVGSEKAYGTAYQKFLESIVLPYSYIERMYASKYARHFYSEEEIRAFKAKWLKKTAGHPC